MCKPIRILAVLFLFAFVSNLSAKTKDGDKLFKAGEKATQSGNCDGALDAYAKAVDADSHEPLYILAFERTKITCSDKHLQLGRDFLKQNRIDSAVEEFRKALVTNPSSQIAMQELENAMRPRNDAASSIASTASSVQADIAEQKRIQERINELRGAPVLRPIQNRITTLSIHNQPARILYETIAKLCGINVLFDPSGIDPQSGPAKTFNLDLKNTTLSDALEYVSLVTHTFWKAAADNAIFVSSESETKRQEYEDELVQYFPFRQFFNQGDFAELVGAIKTGAKITNGLFALPSRNAIIVRGSKDTLALVEKLVNDLDQGRAEVVLDVVVVEVSKSKVTSLGMALSGLNVPVTFAPGGTATSQAGSSSGSNTANTVSVSQLPHLSTHDFQIGIPPLLLQALLTDSSSHILQSPELRVTDGGKATIRIGSKIPYVSGSLSSAVAGPSAVPYATTQFQQLDVGVNIDFQPHVAWPSDINMHVRVELSNVLQNETIAGVQEPIISQKVSEADLCMRDGEMSLMGGLSSDTSSNSVSGIPGIANLPVLGYVFGSHSKDHEKDDILVALVPHIVKAGGHPTHLEPTFAGTSRVVEVRKGAGSEADDKLTSESPPLPPQNREAPLPPTGNPKIVETDSATKKAKDAPTARTIPPRN